MNSKGSLFVKIAAISLIVLVVVSAGWSLATSLGWVNAGVGSGLIGGRLNGNFSGRFPDDGTGQQPQGFRRNGLQPPQDFQGQNGNPLPGQNLGNGNPGSFPVRGGSAGVFGLIRWLGTGFNIAALAIGILAAIGLFKNKRWGVTLAVILSALLGVSSVFGLLRFNLNLTTGISALKVLLGVAVIVLLMLPAARQTTRKLPAAVMDVEEDEIFREIR